jgi:acyl carrier protein
MSQEFKKKLYKIISEKLGVEEETITPESHFAQDLNAGDIEMAELASAIKSSFGVELDQQTLTKAETVGNLMDLVFDQLNGLLDEV